MAEEKENLNDFKRWDAVGAAGFLSMVPAVMCYVFMEHNIKTTLSLAAAGAAVTVAVLALTFIFSEHFVGRVVNWVGNVLALVYFVVAVLLFMNRWCRDDSPLAPPAPQEEQKAGAD